MPSYFVVILQNSIQASELMEALDPHLVRIPHDVLL